LYLHTVTSWPPLERHVIVSLVKPFPRNLCVLHSEALAFKNSKAKSCILLTESEETFWLHYCILKDFLKLRQALVFVRHLVPTQSEIRVLTFLILPSSNLGRRLATLTRIFQSPSGIFWNHHFHEWFYSLLQVLTASTTPFYWSFSSYCFFQFLIMRLVKSLLIYSAILRGPPTFLVSSILVNVSFLLEFVLHKCHSQLYPPAFTTLTAAFII
jgi:hypothetical protein